jgi:ABC-2 type transport system permease protein
MPIFDQGYQHWTGKLSGLTWRWWTITRQGARVGMKINVMNIFLWIVIFLSWLPAFVLAAVLAVWGLYEQKSRLIANLIPDLNRMFGPEIAANPQQFRSAIWTVCFHRFLTFELYFSMVIVLLIGPGLISKDLRFNAFPLYFSRPLRRIDYFTGKLGVIAWFLSLVIIVPSLLAYLSGLAFSLDITVVRDTFPLMLGCLAYGAIIVLSAGTLILGLSSLSRNSRYIALFWVALWFVSGLVGLVLDTVNTEQRRFHRYQREMEVYQAERQPMNKAMTPEEQRAQQRAFEEALSKAEADFAAEEMQAAKTNWRPLVSYTGNLWRLGHLLLNTDAAWTKLSEAQPARYRSLFLANNLGPQYPWYWSAAVLTVLFGISVCLLNFRVRSLDRLK